VFINRKNVSFLSLRSDPISSPTPSHRATPIYMNTNTRSKIPHDVFVYPISSSTSAQQQQPIHARQRYSYCQLKEEKISLNF
jgi:hypothetical protein